MQKLVHSSSRPIANQLSPALRCTTITQPKNGSFGDRAEAEGISLTELLIRFCQQGLGEDAKTEVNVNQVVSTDMLYNAINEAIAPLATRLELLAAEVEKQAA